jgi:hypothetical protein
LPPDLIPALRLFLGGIRNASRCNCTQVERERSRVIEDFDKETAHWLSHQWSADSQLNDSHGCASCTNVLAINERYLCIGKQLDAEGTNDGPIKIAGP